MRTLIFAAALVLSACATAQTPGATPAPAYDSSGLPQHIREDLAQREAALAEAGVVAAGIGQTADLGGGLRVRPLEVLEDSRCPQNARCVWAGRLRLRVAVEGVGEFDVSDDGGATGTDKGAFQLVAVSPGAWTDFPEAQRPPYRFGFKRV
jgi:hypothetical protein